VIIENKISINKRMKYKSLCKNQKITEAKDDEQLLINEDRILADLAEKGLLRNKMINIRQMFRYFFRNKFSI
jgi:hypothetical protein